MTYYCKLCDQSKKDKSKYNHLKSITHKILDESIIKRNIIRNPDIRDIDEIMRNYIEIYKKLWEIFG